MESFVYGMNSLLSSSVDLAALAVLLIALPLFVIFTARAKGGRRFPLRPIPLYARIRQLVNQATESGYPVHVSIGSGRIGSEATPEATMGLTIFDFVARHAATCDQPLQGTTGDPTILPVAQGILRTAREEAGFPERRAGKEITFYGPGPLAYAAGTMNTLTQREQMANIMVGQFGPEALWIAESTADQNITQVGGTSAPSAAALMQASLAEAVVGEEVYAAGAYLHRPSHLGSLAAQDVLRIVITLSIMVGVVMTSLGYWR